MVRTEQSTNVCLNMPADGLVSFHISVSGGANGGAGGYINGSDFENLWVGGGTEMDFDFTVSVQKDSLVLLLRY